MLVKLEVVNYDSDLGISKNKGVHLSQNVFILLFVFFLPTMRGPWYPIRLDQIPIYETTHLWFLCVSRILFLLQNLHFGQHGVSCRVDEAEQEAVGCHLHVGWEDKRHGALVHVPLGEATFDVSSWQDRKFESRWIFRWHLYPRRLPLKCETNGPPVRVFSR